MKPTPWPMLLAVPLALLAPRPLHADPTRTVEVDIVDTPKSGPTHTARFAVAVVEDSRWFATDMREREVSVHLGARIDTHAPNPQLTVQVHRKGAHEVDVQAARGLGSTARMLVARVEHDDGRSELYVTVR